MRSKCIKIFIALLLVGSCAILGNEYAFAIEELETMDKESEKIEDTSQQKNEELATDESTIGKEEIMKEESESEVIGNQLENDFLPIKKEQNKTLGSIAPRSVSMTFMSYPNNDSSLTGINYRVLSEDVTTHTGTVGVECNTRGISGSQVVVNGTGVYLGINGVKNNTITVPETVIYNGYTYTVTELGENVFDGHSSVTTLNLPKTLRKIGKQALAGCALEVLEIPEGVEEIGERALSNIQSKVLILPSTLKKMTGTLTNGKASNLHTVYFNADENVQFIAGGTGNLPFYGFNGNNDAIIMKDKATFEKYRERALNGELGGSITKTLLITYEMDVTFSDYWSYQDLGLGSRKKLMYKDVYLVQNPTTKEWYVDKTNGLPTLPSKYKFWSTGLYNVTQAGYGNFILTDTIFATTASQASTSSSPLSKVFDNKGNSGFAKFLGTVNFDQMHDGINQYFNVKVTYGSTSGPEVSGGQWQKLDSGMPYFAVPAKNVADNGDYYFYFSYSNKYIRTGQLWTLTSSVPVNVNIKPATINVHPFVEKDEFIWNNQTTLPAIKGKENDTKGTYTWDVGEIPKAGTHKYKYTFIPDNVKASGLAGNDILNYTKEKEMGEIEITYRTLKEYNVIFKGMNGAEIITKKVKEGEAAMAPTPPKVDGYEFVGWDKSFANINGDLVVNAIYKKVEEKPTPSVPPVSKPDTGSGVVAKKEETTSKIESNKETPALKERVENKNDGIAIEANDKIFSSNASIFVENSAKKEKEQAKKKLDNVLDVFDVVLKEDGKRVEKTLDSKVRIYLDAKDYKDYKNIKIYQKTKDGNYVELEVKVDGDQLVFECDALDTYVLTGDLVKKANAEEDEFPWWILLVIAAIGMTGYIIYKRKGQEE